MTCGPPSSAPRSPYRLGGSRPHAGVVVVAEEAVASLDEHLGDPIDVDPDEPAVALHDLAVDEYGVDVAAARAADDRADDVAEPEEVQVVAAEQDHVRLLARRQRADLVAEPDRVRAVDRH